MRLSHTRLTALQVLRDLRLQNAAAQANIQDDGGFVGSASKLKLHQSRPTKEMVEHINMFALQPFGKTSGGSYCDDHFMIPNMQIFLKCLGFKSHDELTKKAKKNRVKLCEMDTNGMHKVFSEVLLSSKFTYMVRKAADGVLTDAEEEVFNKRTNCMVIMLKPEAFCVTNKDTGYPQIWPAQRNFVFAKNATTINNQATKVSTKWLDQKTSAASFFYESVRNTSRSETPYFCKCTKCGKIRRVKQGGHTLTQLSHGGGRSYECTSAKTLHSAYRACSRQQEVFVHEIELKKQFIYSSFLCSKVLKLNQVKQDPVHSQTALYADNDIQFAPLLFDPDTRLPVLYCNVAKTLEIRPSAPQQVVQSSTRIMRFTMEQLPIFRQECVENIQFDACKWLSPSDPKHVNYRYCTELNSAVALSTRYICNYIYNRVLDQLRIRSIENIVSLEEFYTLTTTEIYKRNLTPGGPRLSEFAHYLDQKFHVCQSFLYTIPFFISKLFATKLE